MTLNDKTVQELQLLRLGVIRHGGQNGWWQTTSGTNEKLAGRIFPRTKQSALEQTNIAIARRVFDFAAPGVRYHLFSLPLSVESTFSVKPIAEENCYTLQDLAGTNESVSIGVYCVGSLQEFLAGRLTNQIAASYSAWTTGQPMPVPYFSSDAR